MTYLILCFNCNIEENDESYSKRKENISFSQISQRMDGSNQVSYSTHIFRSLKGFHIQSLM